MKQQISIIVLITMTLLFAMPIHFVNAKQVCEKTTLYPLTLPPAILCHPVGKELAAANNANIEFNKGVEAHHNSTFAKNKCPSSNKDFCQGWDFVGKYG